MVKTRIVMKIKSFISLVGICAFTGLLCPTQSMAQKQFTLEDLNFGGNNFYNMRPEARYLTWWAVNWCVKIITVVRWLTP